MNEWEQFEHDLAETLGLQRVPGSGNQWHSKLDVRGKDTLWSLKYTERDTGLRLDKKTLVEAIVATGGIGGTGGIPIWANRIEGLDDFVTMRLSDWISFILSESPFKIPASKSEERKKRASVPQLLREPEDPHGWPVE